MAAGDEHANFNNAYCVSGDLVSKETVCFVGGKVMH